MANDRETITKQEKPSIERLEQRLIFVSHTHADRKLAAAVRTLIEGAFSGLVRAFVSSDPTPTGGLQPGDPWYSEIHAQLNEAVSVWVLATPMSIQRPWIYWEAGIGRVTCPGAVVVLRVGLSSNDLPSPLSNFQSFDGLVAADGGIGELVGKVGNQIGMNLPPVLIESVSEKWLSEAKSHKPEPEGEAPAPKLSPEQLDQFGALIARLEAAVDSTREMVPRARPAPTAVSARRRREAEVEYSRRQNELRAQLVGSNTMIYRRVDKLVEAIGGAPPESTFQFSLIDPDGDAKIQVQRDDETVFIYLDGKALESLDAPAGASAPARALISEIKDELAVMDDAAEEQ